MFGFQALVFEETGMVLFTCVLVRVSIAVKRNHDHGNSYEGKHLTVVAGLQFRGSVIMVGHGSVQADTVLEKELPYVGMQEGS